MTKKLVAKVGTNIGDRRFEEGDTIPAKLLTDRQRWQQIKDGYMEEIDTAAPKPPEPEEKEE